MQVRNECSKSIILLGLSLLLLEHLLHNLLLLEKKSADDPAKPQ